MDETYYHLTAPDWQPGEGLTAEGPDRRIVLFFDLEEAIERAGEYGGSVVEVTLDSNTVTKDPVGLGHPYTTEPIPPSRIKVVWPG